MNEKLKILEMLRQGTITVDEANQLLEAARDTTPQFSEGEVEAPSVHSPDLQRFRYLSYIPFALTLLLLLLTGWGAIALSRRADGRITAGFVMILILLVLLCLSMLLTFAMTRVPWLHLRIRNKAKKDSSRKNFAISLPVPLTLGQWGLRIAQRFVDEEQGTQLDMAASLLRSVKRDLGKPGTDPIVVDVDDADERVQIYIG